MRFLQLSMLDLRPYHGEDLRTIHFFQLWGVDAEAIPSLEGSNWSNEDKGSLKEVMEWHLAKVKILAESFMPQHG